jgi:hypothetical protein
VEREIRMVRKGERNGEEERECVMRAGIVEKHSRAMTYRGVWPRTGESKAKQNKAEEGKAKEDWSWF